MKTTWTLSQPSTQPTIEIKQAELENSPWNKKDRRHYKQGSYYIMTLRWAVNQSTEWEILNI